MILALENRVLGEKPAPLPLCQPQNLKRAGLGSKPDLRVELRLICILMIHFVPSSNILSLGYKKHFLNAV